MSHKNSQHKDSERSSRIRSQLKASGCADSIFELAALPCDTFANGNGTSFKGFCWCPQRLPQGRSVHVASSRLTRKLESFPSWFDALRTFGCSVNRDATFLLTAKGATADRFVLRIAELFGIPAVCVRQFPKKVTQAWIEQQRSPSRDCISTIWVETDADLTIDELLIMIAREVRVLRVRGNGNVHRALMQRVEAKNGDTWMLADDTLSNPEVYKKLIESGARGWWLYGSTPSTTIVGDGEPSTCLADVMLLGEVDSTDFAIHWTRRRHGRWPDQSDSDFLDDLIFRRDASDHRALSSLTRILLTQRIIASSDLTRGSTPVVSFADVRLPDLSKRRNFRSHLGRWDFEPYGIAIRMDCLKYLGARPVVYGDEGDWSRLHEDERPFFQLSQTADGSQDWRLERELRICGDLMLRTLGTRDAMVFVPSNDEALAIASFSRWPVVVLE